MQTGTRSAVHVCHSWPTWNASSTLLKGKKRVSPGGLGRHAWRGPSPMNDGFLEAG